MLAAELSRRLGRLDWESILVFPEEPSKLVDDLLEGCGASVISAPAIFENGLRGAYAFYSLVQEIQPSQVLLSFVPVLSLLPWAGQLGGADNIFFTDQCSRREGEIVNPALGFRKFLGRFLTKPYKQVFCSSNYVRRENVRRGYVAAEGLITLHNSVDFGRTAATHKGAEVRRRLGIRPEKIVISQVSWLRPEKGFDDFLRAAAMALAENQNLHFLIAGDARAHEGYGDSCKELCRQLGIADSVTFAGLVEDPMAEGLYQASDVNCQLSRWQEAFGWAIAEAMAHSKPVIGTRVGGIPEAIEDGVTGYLVPPSDPKAVAQRMLELSRDGELRRRMGQAGYKKAFDEFNLTDNVDGLIGSFGVFESGTLQQATLKARAS
jgi:glycosyltransferase involved in cell wall biosynthesis